MDMKRRISKRKTAPVAEDFKKQNRAKRKRIEEKQLDLEFDEPVFVSASGEPVDLSKTHSTVLHMVNQTRLPLNSRERKKILSAAPKKENEEELMESLRKKRKTGTTVEQAVEIESSSGEDEDIKPPKVIPISEQPKEKPKARNEKKKASHTKFVQPVTTLEIRPDSPETPPPTPQSALDKLVIPTEFSRKMNGRYFLQTETASPGGLAENKPTKLTLGTKDNFHKTCSACASEDHDIFGCRNMFCTYCTEKGHRAADCPMKKKRSTKCDWCGKAGHAETNCPVKQYLITEDDVKDARCLVCGQVGHLDCGKPRKSLKRVFCFNCGEKHLGLECQQPSFTDMLEAELQESNGRREKRTDIRSRQTEFFIREFLLNSN